MSTKRQSTKRWREGGWATYAEAYKAFGDLRHRLILENHLRPGDPLPVAFNEFGLWLVAGHPSAQDMLEHGLAYFTFHANGRTGVERKSHGYTFVDQRGTAFHFSVATALKGFGASKAVRIQAAFRNAVFDQTRECRTTAFQQRARCPETGVLLEESNTEIDHTGADFADLLRNFFRQMRLDPEQVAVTDSRIICDGEIAYHWREYHRAHAGLEAVSKEGHALRTQRRRNNPFGVLRT